MSATETPQAGPILQLLGKLREVAQAIGHVEKTGTNDHHRYDYVEASHLFSRVNAELIERGVLFSAAVVPGSLQHFTETGGKGFVTSVDLRCTFTDTETGATESFDFAGAGADVGGDKGLYKAITGGRKYALLSYFNIATGEDPEADRMTESGAPAQHERGGTRDQDADRPPAPPIPLDRAKAILEQAQAVGLVNDDDSFTPVLKAQLQTLGVAKIGSLNADTAEAMEAFLRDEAAPPVDGQSDGASK